MKQSKGHNDDLKPEHKKTTNRTKLGPSRDIDHNIQSQSFLDFGEEDFKWFYYI